MNSKRHQANEQENANQQQPNGDNVPNHEEQPNLNPGMPEAHNNRMNEDMPNRMGQQQQYAQPNLNPEPNGNRINEDEQLDRELERARKRMELLRLQRELLQMEVRRFDFAAFEGMVHKFTGDDVYDVKKWFVDIEEAFAMYNCNERDKLIAVKRVIDGTAKLMLRSKQIPSYARFKRIMIEEFGCTISAREVYRQLQARKLNKNESIRHYVATMEEIANQAVIAEVELVDCIVEGIQDKSQDATVLYTAQTLQQLKLALKRYETKRSERTQLPESTQKPNATGAIPKRSGQATTPVDTATVLCYNCLEYGHYQSRRPKFRISDGSNLDH